MMPALAQILRRKQLLASLGGAAIACVAPAFAFAASAHPYNPAPTPIFDNAGALARGARAYFYFAGTSTPLTVYRDAALTTPWTFPVSAGANGVLPGIFLPYQDYRVRITTSAGAVVYEQDNIANPAPASSGGGGATPDSQLFQTGYIIARMSGGPLDGFVRMNGRTIGSASSGGTERANADTQNLFLLLCSNLSDSIAAMGGGRGASCAADWAANKAIAIPSMQGRVAAGVDDMGSTAANVLQVSTTATATNGSQTISVTSASGIARTMFAIIDGAAAGQVNSISGTIITLSVNYAGISGGGKAARFSFFSDAQTAGLSGGSQSASMTPAEMATHNHGVTDPGHTHSYAQPSSNVSGLGGVSNTASIVAGFVGASVTGLSINNNGSGLPSSIVQPSRLVNFYLKL